MKRKIAQIAVLNVEEGEEIFAGYATGHIPQVGIYKLLAKKKAAGTIEWAHFVQRDNGLKEKVIRGEVNTVDEFNLVLDAVNGNLRRIFGATMKAASVDVHSLDGSKVSDTLH